MKVLKRKLKKLYLSRDSGGYSQYELWVGKPEYETTFGGRLYQGRELQAFCAKDFQRVTGVSLKPGECVKVEITVTEVAES